MRILNKRMVVIVQLILFGRWWDLRLIFKYELDGVVFKINDLVIQVKFGVVGLDLCWVVVWKVIKFILCFYFQKYVLNFVMQNVFVMVDI